MVSKVRTTVTLDEQILKAVKVKAARMGKGDSELIEEALRRDLGLDVLDRLWMVNDMTEEEATLLAVEAQHETRKNH
jgi:metal-responsive CopG/Arc/MetJ family transcriptional regulator